MTTTDNDTLNKVNHLITLKRSENPFDANLYLQELTKYLPFKKVKIISKLAGIFCLIIDPKIEHEA